MNDIGELKRENRSLRGRPVAAERHGAAGATQGPRCSGRSDGQKRPDNHAAQDAGERSASGTFAKKWHGRESRHSTPFPRRHSLQWGHGRGRGKMTKALAVAAVTLLAILVRLLSQRHALGGTGAIREGERGVVTRHV